MHLDLSASQLNCFDARTLALEIRSAVPRIRSTRLL
jgi:hypothetical protein